MCFVQSYRRFPWFMLLLSTVMTGMTRTDESVRSAVSHTITGFELIARPWYKYRADGQPGREISLVPVGGKIAAPATIITECEGKKETTHVTTAADTVSILLPAKAGLTNNCTLHVTLQTSHQRLDTTILVPAKKQWTVYIYPHAHVDIGYTATQETVQKLQVRNIDVAIDIARKTQHYPAGARFVWNPEANWVVSSYLKTATPEKKKAFIEAVRKGWIRVDAGHSNINTSICSDEEQMQIFRNVHQVQSLTGVPVTTMVQMDLPGASWGIVQAAAQNGVHGFISFPNYYDVRKTFEHKPFYWLAPDGKSRLLFLQAFPYGIGYTIKGSKYGLHRIQAFTDAYDRLSSESPLRHFIDPLIFEETAKLERDQSPYDIFALTWSMADNCLIDADLPEAVRIWNNTYAYPKLVIAGAKEILEAYEKKYSTIIPTKKGDFSEWWTDGLGSDARRVAMSRRGKEDIVQAETLWSMLYKNASAPVEQMTQVWENLLLAAEHTWGAMTPGTSLAREIEGNKAANFEKAAQVSRQLIAQALQPIEDKNSQHIAIINTLSWARNGLVVLLPEQSKAGDKVLNESGKELPSQRLTTGELIFLSNTIPALGSAMYRVAPGKYNAAENLATSATTLRNEFITVTIDEKTGNVTSLKDLSNNRELVDPYSTFKLNSYNYQTGVYNGKGKVQGLETTTETTVHVKENGPLLASILITSKAPGCNAFTREVRLVKGQRQVDFINTFDKIATRKKESIHIGFAFNIPGGHIRMDIPWGVMTPEQDQLPGANRNWLSFQRWIDISNTVYGITYTALETPLVEIGSITGTILDGARQADRWIKILPPTQTIFSWPVNNHWDTNFPPEQGGIITTTYSVLLHGAYDVVAANRFGVAQHRPLIAIQTNANPVVKPLLAIDNDKVMMASLRASEDNRAMVMRLRSFSDKPEKVQLSFPSGKPVAMYHCITGDRPSQTTNGTITVPSYGAVTIRMVF